MKLRTIAILTVLIGVLVATAGWLWKRGRGADAPVIAHGSTAASNATQAAPHSVLEAPATPQATREPKSADTAPPPAASAPPKVEPTHAPAQPLIPHPRALDESQLSASEFEKVLEERYKGLKRDELERAYETLRDALDASGSLDTDDPNRPTRSELELLEKEVGWLKARAFS